MAIANVGVTGNGNHFRQNGIAVLSRRVKLILYVLLYMSNFKELPFVSDYQRHSCHIVCKERHALNASAKLDFRLTRSARALSATGSWLTLSRVNECTAVTDCTNSTVRVVDYVENVEVPSHQMTLNS